MGRLIDTLLSLRLRMFAVNVLRNRLGSTLLVRNKTHGKRACGFVISSGRNRLWLA
jgi:hypothetical protein